MKCYVVALIAVAVIAVIYMILKAMNQNSSSSDASRSPRPTIVGNTFVCPRGWKWSPADRACVPGGFGA